MCVCVCESVSVRVSVSGWDRPMFRNGETGMIFPAGIAQDYLPSSKRLPTAIPAAREGLLFRVGSLVSLDVLNTSSRIPVHVSS